MNEPADMRWRSGQFVSSAAEMGRSRLGPLVAEKAGSIATSHPDQQHTTAAVALVQVCALRGVSLRHIAE